MFSDPLILNGENYDFSLTNGEGRLHINDLDQKFVYLRMLGALTDSIIYLMIIHFLRKIFKSLTENKYFVSFFFKTKTFYKALNGWYPRDI